MKQTPRQFGFMFAGVVAALTVILLLFGSWQPILGGITAIFAAIAAIKPILLLPLERLWRKFAMRLARINNFVVLGIVWYCVLTPAGKVFAIFGWDPMSRRDRRDTETYFVVPARSTTPESYSDQF